MATNRLRCPVCRIVLPEDGTHCPRCGLRVAALPRRPRPEGAAPPRQWVADEPRAAALQGVRAGAIAIVAAVVVGIAVHIAGGPGRAVAGDALFAAVGLLVVAAVLMPGVHLDRWAERKVMEERARVAHRIDPRRAFVLAAAAVCAVGLLATALVPS